MMVSSSDLTQFLNSQVVVDSLTFPSNAIHDACKYWLEPVARDPSLLALASFSSSRDSFHAIVVVADSCCCLLQPRFPHPVPDFDLQLEFSFVCESLGLVLHAVVVAPLRIAVLSWKSLQISLSLQVVEVLQSLGLEEDQDVLVFFSSVWMFAFNKFLVEVVQLVEGLVRPVDLR